MFNAKSFDELNNIVGSDKEAIYIVESLEKLNQDKYFGALYDANVIQKKTENSARYEGYEEGARDKMIEIALSMLESEFEIDVISNITGLAIEEINELKQTTNNN